MIAVDLTGYGASQPGREAVTLTDHAKDIQKTLDSMELTSFILVGHSLGGAVAMKFAELFPEKLLGLILIDSVSLHGLDTMNYAALETVVSQEELLIASLLHTLAVPVSPEIKELMTRECLKAKAAFIPNTHALERADFSQMAAAFAKPVLVIHGKLDNVIPYEAGQALAKAFPSGEFILFDAVGHNPPLEDPDLLTAQLVRFLAKV